MLMPKVWQYTYLEDLPAWLNQAAQGPIQPPVIQDLQNQCHWLQVPRELNWYEQSLYI